MPSSLSELGEQLYVERTSFMDALDAARPDLRTAKPTAGAWSPLEIAKHLYQTERSVLRGITRQVDPKNEIRDFGKPSRAKFVALIFALRSPVKFKVPPNAEAIIPNEMTYEEIWADWPGFQVQWDSVVESFPSDLLSIGLILHPVTGPMTLAQSLQFLAVHSARHYKQLERTIADLTAMWMERPPEEARN